MVGKTTELSDLSLSNSIHYGGYHHILQPCLFWYTHGHPLGHICRHAHYGHLWLNSCHGLHMCLHQNLAMFYICYWQLKLGL